MWGWLALIVGIAYGYFSPGRQDKMDLFKKGLLYGAIIAVILAVVGLLFRQDVLGMGTGLVANIIAAIIITLLFIGGVWLGDWIEHRRAPRKA